MAEDRTDIIIEGNTAVWEIKMEGGISGTFMGKFRFRCFLTPTQTLAAGREYREMLGSQALLAPQHESLLAYSLSQLKYRILEAPPFWSSTAENGIAQGDLPDEEVINAVLDAAVDAELKFKSQIKKRKEEALLKAKDAAERFLAQQKAPIDDDFDEMDEK